MTKIDYIRLTNWDGVSVPVQPKTKRGTKNLPPASIFALGLKIENYSEKSYNLLVVTYYECNFCLDHLKL